SDRSGTTSTPTILLHMYPENWLKLPPRETNNNNTNKNRRMPNNIDTIKAMIKELQPEKEPHSSTSCTTTRTGYTRMGPV
ncbi:31739_t:CDS:2, partial [Gigaspora margarita]